MRPHEREELARLAYLRALALARAQPSVAASWNRLLRASKNLKAAVRDRARTRVRFYARAQVAAPAAPVPGAVRVDTTAVAPPRAAPLPVPAPERGKPPRDRR